MKLVQPRKGTIVFFYTEIDLAIGRYIETKLRCFIVPDLSYLMILEMAWLSGYKVRINT